MYYSINLLQEHSKKVYVYKSWSDHSRYFNHHLRINNPNVNLDISKCQENQYVEKILFGDIFWYADE